DTHVQSTDDQLIDNTTGMIRLMLLSALVIGIAITHALLKDRSLINGGLLKDSYLITGRAHSRQQSAASGINPHTSTPSTPQNTLSGSHDTTVAESDLSNAHAKLKQRRRRRMPNRKTHYRR
ncbi:MAG: hypothetical protein ACRCUL_09720, partial [Plesiomonas sp.]